MITARSSTSTTPRPPPAEPAGWPAYKPNERGLSRFVYGHMHDYVRRVARGVVVGKAYRHGKEQDAYFSLTLAALTSSKRPRPALASAAMWSSQGRIARALALAIALVTVPGAAIAAPGHKAKVTAKKAKGEKTKGGKGKARSIGAPNHGHLEGAALLKQNKSLKQREGSHSWALPQMVGMLHRAPPAWRASTRAA